MYLTGVLKYLTVHMYAQKATTSCLHMLSFSALGYETLNVASVCW
jgi:hypothetical protein